MSQSGSANVFVHLTLSSVPSSPIETQSLSVMDECATCAKKKYTCKISVVISSANRIRQYGRAKQKPGEAPAAQNNSGFCSSLCSSAARRKKLLIKINQTQ